MGLAERLYWVSDTAVDRVRLHRMLGIKPTDYVLDVGSGAGPNIRANVLCDKYAMDGTERHGQPLRTDRPCIVGDVEGLPFVTRAFDYVICSHLLEHVTQPELAIAELKRVAPRGYIETPSASWEKLQGYPFHRWLVWNEGGVLHFEEKPGPIWDAQLEGWFASLQDRLRLRKSVWSSRRRLGLFTSLVWETEIPYEVHRHAQPLPDFVAASLDRATEDIGEPGGNLGRAAESWVSERLRRQSDRPPDYLESLLACPRCHKNLARDDGAYRCAECDINFPLDPQGRPWLLLAADRKT